MSKRDELFAAYRQARAVADAAAEAAAKAWSAYEASLSDLDAA